jgi:ribonucleoside-diphosphate reductase alpha chain
MMARERLPNRRVSEQIAFACGRFKFIATVSRFPDGRLAEIFLTNGKCGSDSEVSARDAAVIASIALQHGVPVEVLWKALMRDSHGAPSGPLGMVLDLLIGEANSL